MYAASVSDNESLRGVDAGFAWNKTLLGKSSGLAVIPGDFRHEMGGSNGATPSHPAMRLGLSPASQRSVGLPPLSGETPRSERMILSWFPAKWGSPTWMVDESWKIHL